MLSLLKFSDEKPKGKFNSKILAGTDQDTFEFWNKTVPIHVVNISIDIFIKYDIVLIPLNEYISTDINCRYKTWEVKGMKPQHSYNISI